MKSERYIILLIVVIFLCFETKTQDTLYMKGQLSAWGLFNPDNNLPLWIGGRYIPQLNYEYKSPTKWKIDYEASANINGSAGMHLFDTLSADGKIKPYRFWVRYSTRQFELRMGLQKINFGSASMIRPLMWFDQVDPRDPLQLTDGVWGMLGRYYFLNNANIWLWALYSNEKPKTWEIGKTSQRYPELGGRIQLPVKSGEAAISYHFRMADMHESDSTFISISEIPENRIGLDGKWDMGVGVWFEGAWINKSGNSGIYTNEEILNAGIDYTFGIGNGLSIVFEHLLFSYDRKPFEFSNMLSFSGISATYPLGMFDMINTIVFYDWTNKSFYNFINWKKSYNKTSLYLMAFWNPMNYNMPQQDEGGRLFAGKGVQVMFVYNH